jgi:pyruvate dehydrogenase E2 component (dihydrolipoamide acetyltransferase)
LRPSADRATPADAHPEDRGAAPARELGKHPHVTQFDEADITALEEARVRLKDEAAAQGIKLTILAFVMRACAKALQAFPHFGSSLDAASSELVYQEIPAPRLRGGHPGGSGRTGSA